MEPVAATQSGGTQPAHIDRRAIESSVNRASAQLNSAMLTADSTRLSSVLAADASFVDPSGLLTRGSGAIPHAVALLRDTNAQRLSIVLGDRRAETCVDGGRDEGLYSIQQIAADGSRSTTASGMYVAVWHIETDGHSALRTIVLASDSTPHSVLQRARCATVADNRFDHGRIFITAFPLGIGNANTGSQAEATLTARGWTASGDRLATAPASSRPELVGIRSGSGVVNNIARIAVRARLISGVGLEVSDQFTPITGLISRSNTADHEYDAKYDERESSLLMTLEKSRFRLGLGAARVAARWHEVTYSAQYNSAGRFEIVTIDSLNTTAVGPEALLAFTQPFGAHAFFEIALASRYGLRSSMQPVPGYDAWMAHFDGESLTIGFGALF